MIEIHSPSLASSQNEEAFAPQSTHHSVGHAVSSETTASTPPRKAWFLRPEQDRDEYHDQGTKTAAIDDRFLEQGAEELGGDREDAGSSSVRALGEKTYDSTELTAPGKGGTELDGTDADKEPPDSSAGFRYRFSLDTIFEN